MQRQRQRPCDAAWSHSFTAIERLPLYKSKINFALCAIALLCTLQGINGRAQTNTVATEVGKFDRVVGRVTVQALGGTARTPERGSAVIVGELVATDDDSEATITTRDGARLVLRGKSRLEMTNYSFEPTTNEGTFISRLLKGSLRTVTGLIGKAQPRNHSVSTTTATVGIRGTDFEVAVFDADEDDKRAGTYDHVFDGATTLQVASGEALDVPKDKTGLALSNPRPGEPQLQLLDSRPAFIRGGGFDALQLLQTRPTIIIRPIR